MTLMVAPPVVLMGAAGAAGVGAAGVGNALHPPQAATSKADTQIHRITTAIGGQPLGKGKSHVPHWKYRPAKRRDFNHWAILSGHNGDSAGVGGGRFWVLGLRSWAFSLRS